MKFFAPVNRIVWINVDFNMDLSTISNYHDFDCASIDVLFKNRNFRGFF